MKSKHIIFVMGIVGFVILSSVFLYEKNKTFAGHIADRNGLLSDTDITEILVSSGQRLNQEKLLDLLASNRKLTGPLPEVVSEYLKPEHVEKETGDYVLRKIVIEMLKARGDEFIPDILTRLKLIVQETEPIDFNGSQMWVNPSGDAIQYYFEALLALISSQAKEGVLPDGDGSVKMVTVLINTGSKTLTNYDTLKSSIGTYPYAMIKHSVVVQASSGPDEPVIRHQIILTRENIMKILFEVENYYNQRSRDTAVTE